MIKVVALALGLLSYSEMAKLNQLVNAGANPSFTSKDLENTGLAINLTRPSTRTYICNAHDQVNTTSPGTSFVVHLAVDVFEVFIIIRKECLARLLVMRHLVANNKLYKFPQIVSAAESVKMAVEIDVLCEPLAPIDYSVIPTQRQNLIAIHNAALRVYLESHPWPLLSPHNFIGLESSFRRSNRGFVGSIGGTQSKDQNTGRSNREKCHDPLCERIARANERPKKAVPLSAYLTVVLLPASFGAIFTYFVSLVVEPKEKVEG